MQKTLIVIGFIFIIAGIILPWIQKTGIGQLPGDILFRRANFTFYFPVTTSIIISLALSLFFWLIHK
jgi:hypothetical protein